jgi:hypothetical protein
MEVHVRYLLKAETDIEVQHIVVGDVELLGDFSGGY